MLVLDVNLPCLFDSTDHVFPVHYYLHHFAVFGTL
jgi:hypothetical protein